MVAGQKTKWKGHEGKWNKLIHLSSAVYQVAHFEMTQSKSNFYILFARKYSLCRSCRMQLLFHELSCEYWAFDTKGNYSTGITLSKHSSTRNSCWEFLQNKKCNTWFEREFQNTFSEGFFIWRKMMYTAVLFQKTFSEDFSWSKMLYTAVLLLLIRMYLQ